MATVLVVGKRTLLADSLVVVLRTAGYDVRRVACISQAAAVTARMVGPYPQIAIVDADQEPFGDQSEAIELLAGVGIAVVALTQSLDRGQWGGLVRRGVRCVLAMSAPLPELLVTLHQLSQGQLVMSRQERADLIEQWRRQREDVEVLRDRFRRLTPRERELLEDLLRGLAIHDIAVEDAVSEATVRTQVKSILRKLEVPSQLSAVALAHTFNWGRAANAPRAAGRRS